MIMEIIKKFEEFDDEAYHIVYKLKKGFAICISKNRDGVKNHDIDPFDEENWNDDYVNKFFNMLRNNIPWIELPESSEHYTSDKYYFILIGNKLLHNTKPYLGGHELDVYTPNI